MSEFTKGKWKYMNDGTIRACRPNSDILINIIEMTGFKDFKKVLGEEKAREMIDANARLAAAAPEMYKLLEEANQIFYLWRRTNNDEDERRSVIDEINERYKDFEINSMNLLARIDGEEHEELHEVEAQE